MIHRRYSIVCVCAAAFAAANIAIAAPPPAGISIRKRAAELVVLNDGTRMEGLWGPDDGAGNFTFVVRRAWLKQHDAATHDRLSESEAESSRTARQTTLNRLQDWRKGVDKPAGLVSFLEAELNRLEKAQTQAAEDADSPYLVARFDHGQVERHFRQPNDRRALLAWAWLNDVAKAENQPAGTLQRECQKLGGDPAASALELTSKLPPGPESEDQWSARQALIEFRFQQEPHFQGTAGVLIRDGAEAGGDLAQLATQLLGDQLGGILTEAGLDGGANASPAARYEKSLRSALAEAGKDGFRGVRVTRLEQNPLTQSCTVHGQFLVRVTDGTWRVVWEHSARADRSQVGSNEDVKRLEQDPRISKVIAAARALGVDGDTLAAALAAGAATESALEPVHAAFAEFMLSHAMKVDGSPVTLSAPIAAEVPN